MSGPARGGDRPPYGGGGDRAGGGGFGLAVAATAAAVTAVAIAAASAAVAVDLAAVVRWRRWSRWASSVLPPAQDVPVLGRRRTQDRLQGRQASVALHFRTRQDRAFAHHGRLGEEATRTGGRDQARPLPRAIALRRFVRAGEKHHASHPARTRRKARPNGRRRQSEGRVRPQLPAAAQKGLARDEGQHRAIRGTKSATRSPQSDAQEGSRRRRRPSSTSKPSSSCARPAKSACSTARSRPAIFPMRFRQAASRSTAAKSSSTRRSRRWACIR